MLWRNEGHDVAPPQGGRPKVKATGKRRVPANLQLPSGTLLAVPSPWPLTARSAQLERISILQVDGGVGGVVLTGPAGVGKTRLSCLAAGGRSTSRSDERQQGEGVPREQDSRKPSTDCHSQRSRHGATSR